MGRIEIQAEMFTGNLYSYEGLCPKAEPRWDSYVDSLSNIVMEKISINGIPSEVLWKDDASHGVRTALIVKSDDPNLVGNIVAGTEQTRFMRQLQNGDVILKKIGERR